MRKLVWESIAAYLASNGIKQIFLSDRTGLSPQCISFILQGKRRLDVEEYARICHALGVSYDYFFPKVASEQRDQG